MINKEGKGFTGIICPALIISLFGGGCGGKRKENRERKDNNLDPCHGNE